MAARTQNRRFNGWLNLAILVVIVVNVVVITVKLQQRLAAQKPVPDSAADQQIHQQEINSAKEFNRQ